MSESDDRAIQCELDIYRPPIVRDRDCILLHLNVQSVFKKTNLLEAALVRTKPHFLCLTETWIDGCRADSVRVQGYTVVTQYYRKILKHGGVALMADDEAAALCTPVDWIADLSVEAHFESAGMRYGRGTCIVTIYRSSKSREYDLFFKKFELLISRTISRYQYVVICGDLNIHGESVNERYARQLFDILQSYGLTNHVREPTRYVNGVGSMLDFVISNMGHKVFCEVVELGISDHLSQIAVWSLSDDEKRCKKESEFVMKRFYTADAIAEFRFRFNRVQLNISDMEHQNINEAFGAFWVHFIWCFETSFPKRRARCCHQNKFRFKYTPDLIRCSESLKFLNWIRKSVDSEQLGVLYHNFRKQFNDNIYISKSNYYSSLINGSGNKSRTFWKLVNDSRGVRRDRAPITLKTDVGLIGGQLEVANRFGGYFSTIVGQQMRTHFTTVSRTCTRSMSQPMSMFFRPVTEGEVIGIVGGLRDNSAPGLEGVPVKLLKACCYDMSFYLAELINAAVALGEFPDELKLAKAIPIYKKGDRQLIENYRLITLMSPFSKVIERAVYNRIMDYLCKFKILSACQHGFRPRLSTETATTELIQCVSGAIDAGEHVLGIFFDLSRAFDTLDPKFLSDKLDAIGIRGPVNAFLVSFVVGRRIVVGLGGLTSEEYEIPLGTPQGSVLGPLLFLLYVNDLPNHVKGGKIFMYADDTSIVISHKDVNVVNETVSTVLTQFSKWCESNHLIVNYSKTKYVHFTGQYRDPLNLNIRYQNSILVASQAVKFLGTTVDMKLDWVDHIDNLCSRLNSFAYAFLNMKKVFDNGRLLNIYYGLVYPILSYNIICWGRAVDVGRVLIGQKRILRAVFGLSQMETCRDIFRSNKIMTVVSIYVFKILTYIYDNKKKFEKRSDIHDHYTRSNNLIQLEKINHIYYKKSPDYAGCSLYNGLPERIRNLGRNQFKNAVRSILTSNAFYTLDEYTTHMSGRL